jgi:hypothetical protein
VGEGATGGGGGGRIPLKCFFQLRIDFLATELKKGK